VKFNKQVNSIINENYKSIPIKTRMYYPRNFALSPEFIKSFKKEVTRLKAENVSEKDIIRKLTRALNFHVRD
jgi:hypothetical protein